MNKTQMNRRNFLGAGGTIAMAIPLLPFKTLYGAPAIRSVEFQDVPATISSNHGHGATITRAQLEAQETITLNIQSNATHNHTVSITRTHLQQLRQGLAISIGSEIGNGHSHQLTFTPKFGINGSIEDNHGHSAVLPPPLFKIEIEIQGESNHAHRISLSLEELIQIRDGNKVTVESSESDEHSHRVEFN